MLYEVITLLVGCLLLLPTLAGAEESIEISAPGVETIPIAITLPLPMEGAGAQAIPREVAEVLNADLELSGLFRPSYNFV